jgi:hypothetical protein
MKKLICITLICSGILCNLNAQIDIGEYEKYNSYEQCIYIDNIDQRLLPEIFINEYYSKFDKSKFKVDSQVIDTINYKRKIYVYMQQSKDGYLFVNTKIMNKIKALDYTSNELKVSYVYNDKIILTKDDVKRFVILRKKNIKISTMILNEKLKILCVYVYDK